MQAIPIRILMKIQSFQSCRDLSGMAPGHDYITALSTWLLLADGVYFDAVALTKFPENYALYST